MRIGWYGSEEKFVLLLIHLKSEVRLRRWICFGIKSITLEVRKSRFAIILFLFCKSINQSLVLKSYYSYKVWNINPFSVLKISFISLIHYMTCLSTLFNPTRFIVNSYTLSVLFPCLCLCENFVFSLECLNLS